MKWDDDSLVEILGAGRSFTNVTSICRYVAGCMKRERERIAKIIERTDDPKEIAAAIRDASEDPQVFKWLGPRS